MRKGHDLTGKPVVTFDTGERVEKVRDILFDQNENRILGLLVEEAGWFSSARVIPWNDIQAIGPDAVIVPDRSRIVRAERVPAMKRIIDL